MVKLVIKLNQLEVNSMANTKCCNCKRVMVGEHAKGTLCNTCESKNVLGEQTLGQIFIKEGEQDKSERLYQQAFYCELPTAGLRNIKTGEVISVPIGSDFSKEFKYVEVKDDED